MKKIRLAFLATTAVVGSMTIANADVRTGFYLGANVSMHANLGKARAFDSSLNYLGVYDLGRTNVGGGTFIGYGWVHNCFYFGGEFAYDYDYNKAHVRQPSNGTVIAWVSLASRHVFNFAGLAGYKLTPSTIAYIRLGLNWSEHKMQSRINQIALNRTKSVASFVPGVGMETTLNRNVKARLEYSYDFGHHLRRANGIQKTTIKNIGTHTVKLGMAWTF